MPVTKTQNKQFWGFVMVVLCVTDAEILNASTHLLYEQQILLVYTKSLQVFFIPTLQYFLIYCSSIELSALVYLFCFAKVTLVNSTLWVRITTVMYKYADFRGR